MKTICILTYERTGSGWLCDAMNGPDSFCIHELFSDDPFLFLPNFSKALRLLYSVDNSIVSILNTIYNQDTLHLNVEVYKQLKQNVLSKNPYSIDLFTTIQSLCAKNNCNFVFKLFPQHFRRTNIDCYKIINNCDAIILNYRNNLLETFVSLSLAQSTGVWYSKQKQRALLSNKIMWNKQKYLDFVNHTKLSFAFLKNVYSQTHAPKLMIRYEDIHQLNKSNTEKLQVLYNQLLLIDVDMVLNDTTYFEKQNKLNIVSNSSDIFTNHLDFLEDLYDIPILLK